MDDRDPYEALNAASLALLRKEWEKWWDERLREAVEGEPGEEPVGLCGEDGDE